MTTYTSSLPESTLNQLTAISQQLDIPKNQIINEALTKYFFEIERQQYIASFERVAKDSEMAELGDMGLVDYVDHLNMLDAK